MLIFISGGDREPPEHGLKKYWKQNPKQPRSKKHQHEQAMQQHELDDDSPPHSIKYVPSYDLLQTAANSAGLSNCLDDDDDGEIENGCAPEPAVKKIRRQQNKSAKISTKHQNTSKMILTSSDGTELANTTLNLVNDDTNHVTTNIPNLQATLIAINGTLQNGGYITIPSNGNTITLPSAAVSLQTVQQQQHNIQLQIEMLQQQLAATNQAASLATVPTTLTTVDDNSNYVVTVSEESMEQSCDIVQSVGTPIVVDAVTSQNLNVATQQPYVVNVTQPLMSNIANSGNISFVSSADSMGYLQQKPSNISNLSLLTSSVADELNIINQNNCAINVITPQNTLPDTSVIGMRATAPMENLRRVHLITSNSPTMAALTQPVTYSLQTPSISLSTLPTMLLTQSVPSAELRQASQPQQFIIQQSTSTPEQLIFQRPLLSQPNISEQIVVQQQQSTPTMHCTEQSVAITSSVLPPMTSFNADAFLTSNGTMKYAVLNTGAQIPRSVIDEQPTSMAAMPFLTA